MTTNQSNCSTRFLSRHTIRGTLFIAGFITAINNCNIVYAQSGLSGATNGGSLVNVDNIRGGYRSGFPLDSGGAQQFFEGGLDRIYFLPEEQESGSILKIDKTIEAEGIKYEDLQLQNIDDVEAENE